MAKGTMIIDGLRVPFDGEKNVLSVIRKAGIDMPTFCYYSELSVYGACRMCIVEDVKTGKIDASCSMEPRDGLEIRTNTSRLLQHRRLILELLRAGDMTAGELAEHFDISKPSLSHHLATLRNAGLVTDERHGQNIVYSLNTTVMQDLVGWFMGFADDPEDRQ